MVCFDDNGCDPDDLRLCGKNTILLYYMQLYVANTVPLLDS